MERSENLAAGSIGLAMEKDGDRRIYSHASIALVSPMQRRDFFNLSMAYFEQVQWVKCRTKIMRNTERVFFLETDVVIVDLEDPSWKTVMAKNCSPVANERPEEEL